MSGKKWGQEFFNADFTKEDKDKDRDFYLFPIIVLSLSLKSI